MAGTELATAYVTILPSTQGLGAALNAQMMPQMGVAGKTAGGALSKGILGNVGKIGSALAAIGVAKFLTDSVTKAKAAEVSLANLRQAVTNTGVSFGTIESGIKSAISAESELSAFSVGELRAGLTSLIQVTGDVGKAQSLLGLTADLARAKQMDMGTAAKLVGRVSAGSTSILARYGIVLKKGATATEALAAMQEKFGGAAKAYGDTTQGSIDKAKNALGKLQVTLGNALLPTIGRFASVADGLIDRFDGLSDPVKDAAIGIGAVGTAALLVMPYMSSLTKALNLAKAAAKGLASVNLATSFSGIAASASEAGTAVSLLAGGASIGQVASLGGAAAAATVSVTALAAAAAGAAGYGIGLLINKVIEAVPALKNARDELSGWIADTFMATGSTVELSDAMKAAGYSLDKQGNIIGGNADKLRELQSAASKAADKHDDITGAAGKAADAIDGVTAAYQRETLVMSNGRSAREDALANLVAVKDARKAYHDVLKDPKHTAAEATLAHMKLQDAQKLAAQTADDLTDAQINAAVKAGLLTKEQGKVAKKLNDTKKAVEGVTSAAHKVPSKIPVSVVVSAPNLDTVLHKLGIKTLTELLPSIPIHSTKGNASPIVLGAHILPEASGDIIQPAGGGTLVRAAENGYAETYINWAPANFNRNASLIAATMAGIGMGAQPAAASTAVNVTVNADSMSDRRAIAEVVTEALSSLTRGSRSLAFGGAY